MSHDPERSFEDWVAEGMSNGWVGPPVCSTHDGVPYSGEEEMMLMEGEEPCVHVMRCYEDDGVKAGVEEAHSPTGWRAARYTK